MIAESWPAGRDRAGRELTVVATDDAATDDDSGGETWTRVPCRKYWLLTDTGNAPSQPARHLTTLCGGDKWEVFAEVDRQSQVFAYGGNSVYSQDRSSSRVSIGLNPVRWVEISQSSV